MAQESITVSLAIIGALLTWTVTVVAAVSWISSKLNKHEHLVYRENTKTRDMLKKVLDQHSGRIMRLELARFGATVSEPIGESQGADPGL